MPAHNYRSKSEQLGVIEFGNRLLDTQDHDPVYAMLYDAQMPGDQLKRWLLSYWLFYDVGVASYLSEKRGEEYWSVLFKAVINTDQSPAGGRWPRGSERRHFRGVAASSCYWNLKGMYTEPERFVDYVARGRNQADCSSFSEVKARVKEHRMFGDWVAFKAADMLERMGICDVSFVDADLLMYSEPRAGALMAFGELFPERAMDFFSEEEKILGVTDVLGRHYSLRLAPPSKDRMVNIQEIETVLCKWKSHRKGHYWVGKDIVAILESMSRWSFCRTASDLVCHIPDEVEYESE